MIRMAKKGVEHTKLVAKSSVGIRKVEELGPCICLKFDDFELMMSPEKAKGMATTIFSRLRAMEKKALEEGQHALSLEA